MTTGELAACVIGVRPCGCVVAMAVDTPELHDVASRAIAEMRREALAIETVTVAEARARFTTCTCATTDQPLQRELALPE